MVWYSNKAVSAVSTAAARKRRRQRPYWNAVSKNFKKSSWQSENGMVNLKSCWWYETDRASKNFWKKYLTNGMKFSIIAMFRRERRVPCKLNNVTKRKHQTVSFRVRNHKKAPKKLRGRVQSITGARNYKNMKLWQIALWKISSNYGSCWYHFIESLILAQDERWRRA